MVFNCRDKEHVLDVLATSPEELEAVDFKLVGVGHQVYRFTLLLLKHLEQARVEGLLGKEAVAEVKLARHDINVDHLGQGFQKFFESVNTRLDARVHLLVQLLGSVATA